MLLLGLAIGAWFVVAKPHRVELTPEPLVAPHIPRNPEASLSQLPPHLQATLKDLCGSCTFAGSNDPWTSTDVVMDSSLPRRRLIDVRRIDQLWSVKYERGGMFTSEYTVVFTNDTPPKIAAGSSCIPTQEKVCKW